MTKLMKIFILLLLHINSLTSYSGAQDTLRNLFIIHRHGDRTPEKTYPNDPYADDSNFPDGFGQLTNSGKQRMYNVGRYLRKIYTNFLGESIRNVHVRSSGKIRCLESTQLLVNGAFPPTGRWLWNDAVNFQPVGVQTTDFDHDSMMNMFAPCSSADKELTQVLAGQFGTQIHMKYWQLFEKLTIYTGAQIETFLSADYVYDLLKNEKLTVANFTPPWWASDEMMTKLEAMHFFKFKMFSQSKQIQRLRLGVFLNEFAHKLHLAISTSDTEKKLHLIDSDDTGVKRVNVYSTHDIFLYNLLDALHISNPYLPDFGASIIFELHQRNDTESNFFVRVFYMNDTKSNDFNEFNISPLKMGGCEIDCPVDKFMSTFSELLMSEEEWQNACKFDRKDIMDASKSSSSSVYTITIVIETCLIILLFVYIASKFRSHK